LKIHGVLEVFPLKIIGGTFYGFLRLLKVVGGHILKKPADPGVPPPFMCTTAIGTSLILTSSDKVSAVKTNVSSLFQSE
jgi:hypothetical protein